MLLSIIIPAYNASNTICRCLDSILCQTFRDFEVIIVNDGSKDSTGELCHGYAGKDIRIQVIDKENAGVSAARNDGINIAQGEYIQFVDADDYLDSNMCQLLIEKMLETNSDLVLCGFIREYFTENHMCGCERRSYPNCNVSGCRNLGKHFGVLYEKMLISSLWNKLFKSTIIRKNQLKMPPNISLGEDLLFNLEYINLCNSISIIEQCPYHYTCAGNDSLTGGYNGTIDDNAELLYREVTQFCISNHFFEESNWSISKMYLRTGFRRLQNYMNTMERQALFQQIRQYYNSVEVKHSVRCTLHCDAELFIYILLIKLRIPIITYIFLQIRPLIKKMLIYWKK